LFIGDGDEEPRFILTFGNAFTLDAFMCSLRPIFTTPMPVSILMTCPSAEWNGLEFTLLRCWDCLNCDRELGPDPAAAIAAAMAFSIMVSVLLSVIGRVPFMRLGLI
jgi:hypothetical protein